MKSILTAVIVMSISIPALCQRSLTRCTIDGQSYSLLDDNRWVWASGIEIGDTHISDDEFPVTVTGRDGKTYRLLINGKWESADGTVSFDHRNGTYSGPFCGGEIEIEILGDRVEITKISQLSCEVYQMWLETNDSSPWKVGASFQIRHTDEHIVFPSNFLPDLTRNNAYANMDEFGNIIFLPLSERSILKKVD